VQCHLFALHCRPGFSEYKTNGCALYSHIFCSIFTSQFSCELNLICFGFRYQAEKHRRGPLLLVSREGLKTSPVIPIELGTGLRCLLLTYGTVNKYQGQTKRRYDDITWHAGGSVVWDNRFLVRLWSHGYAPDIGELVVRRATEADLGLGVSVFKSRCFDCWPG
jgi:hypothetical protein